MLYIRRPSTITILYFQTGFVFCTYCVEFNSYNYPNILFQMLSTL